MTSNKKLKKGELIVVGLHPNYRFYCNDTERVWAMELDWIWWSGHADIPETGI